MDIGSCHLVVSDELGFLAYNDMILIAVLSLTTLLCPTSIHIFMALLVRLIVPQLASLSFLYLIVFIPTIALSWGKYETRIFVLRFAIEDSQNLLHPR